ncbi:MAG TPA: AAC(3) family N-acetyltransferase [Anaerolineales bacterium]|nr:AAC(3) family N-acetyltransferase [Anaerolineales bacterium]
MNLKPALSDLSLSKRLVLVHASPAVDANDLLESLLATTSGFITPTFTPKALLPLDYHPVHTKADVKSLAQAFTPSTPADEAFGAFAELVRKHPKARRSLHPVLSFAGIGADVLIHSQTVQEPYAPIASLADEDGVILLIGMDQRVNFSIHYGEKLAGRMQFIRWALTDDGVVECPNFPGDSEGFNAISLTIKPITRQSEVDGILIQAIPAKDLLRAVVNKIHDDAYSLLCGRPDCERCEAVRWG